MIEDLLEHLGIEDIRPLGVEVQARCPMHEKRTGERERRPDHWSINRVSGAHHCFSCEYSGSLTRLVMDLSSRGLWEAHQLIRSFDVELDRIEEAPWEPAIGAVVGEQIESFGLPPTRSVERRHLTLEAVQRFHIRWDREDQAWILPIVSPTGETWGWQSKSQDKIRNQPPGIKKGRTLFGIEVLASDTFTVLVESPLDAAYLYTLDIPAVAAFGCQISDLQMHLLVERVDELVLALDNDKAGIAETRRLIEDRWHHRMRIRVFDYTDVDGKDPGELSADEVARGVKYAHLAAFW